MTQQLTLDELREIEEGRRRARVLTGRERPAIKLPGASAEDLAEFEAGRFRGLEIKYEEGKMRAFQQGGPAAVAEFENSRLAFEYNHLRKRVVAPEPSPLDRSAGQPGDGPSRDQRQYYSVSGRFDLVSGNRSFARFKKTVLREGRWTHPSAGFTVNASPQKLREFADRFRRYKGHVDIWVALGHSRDPRDGVGHIDDMRVERGNAGDELVATLDIRDPGIVEKLRAGTLRGVSVCINPLFKTSTPDGKVDLVGDFIEHVAIVQDPAVGGMGEFVQLT